MIVYTVFTEHSPQYGGEDLESVWDTQEGAEQQVLYLYSKGKQACYKVFNVNHQV